MVSSCSIGIPYSWWESHELVLFGLQMWERMFLLFLFVLFLTFGFYGSTQLHKYSYLFLAQAQILVVSNIEKPHSSYYVGQTSSFLLQTSCHCQVSCVLWNRIQNMGTKDIMMWHIRCIEHLTFPTVKNWAPPCSCEKETEGSK